MKWEEWPQIFNPPQSMFAPGEPLHPVQQEQVRSLDFPVGVNQVIRQRWPEVFTFSELKAFANVELCRLAIETRKDQIERLEWQVKPRAILDSSGRPKQNRKDAIERIRSAEKFFKKPNQWEDFHTWLRIVIEDLLVLDAPTFELQRTRGGALAALQHIPGDTIKVLVDHNGRRPVAPAPAYQQIIKGRVWANLTDEDIIYAPRNPRSGKLYGFGPVEQCIVTINTVMRRQASQLAYFCYSDDTEVLTKRGWLRFADTNADDEFATRRAEVGSFEWQKPYDTFRKHYRGDMVHFTGKGVDVLVTPNHRMLVKKKGGKEQVIQAAELARKPSLWRIPLTTDGWEGVPIERMQFGVTAYSEARQIRNERISQLRAEGVGFREIGKQLGIATSAVFNATKEIPVGYVSECDIDGDDYCALLGMYLSEGCVSYRGHAVVISQRRESQHFEKFQRALGKIAPVMHDGREFHIHRTALAHHLKQFGHSHEKFVPPEIMNATARQIGIFLDYLIDGDGTRNPGGRINYYTASKRLADQVQELAQKIGRPATICVSQPRSSVMSDGREIKAENCRRYYTVSIGKRAFRAVKAEHVFYDGEVFCVSVPNGTVYVRRGGKSCWSGNSDGTVPAGMATVPDGWTVDQTKEWQEWMDSVFSGNLAERRKLLWAPAGSKYQAFKEAPIKDDFDEWLARIICYCFSLPPTPFIRQMNRSTAQSDTERALEEGLAPLLVWAKRVADNLLWNELDFRDLEFAWGESKEMNIEDRANVNNIYIRAGVLTINEVRDTMGLDPVADGDTPLIYTNQGALTIEMILNQPDPIELANAKAQPKSEASATTAKAANFEIEDDRTREIAEIAGGIEALRLPLLQTMKRCEYKSVHSEAGVYA